MRGGDVEKCTNVLVNTGSQRSTEPDCDYHRQFKKDGIEYELHWMVKGSQYSSQTIKTFMKDIIDTSVFRSGMNMPDDFHHGLVLLLHMISHITEGGLGLRQLCDWAVYVNRVDLSGRTAIRSAASGHLPVLSLLPATVTLGADPFPRPMRC